MSKNKTVNMSEIPFGKSYEEFSADTVFILDEDDSDDWEDEFEDE